MKNIIITESQLRLITEKLGVPDSILNTAKEVFDMIAVNLNSIDEKEDEYTFNNYPHYELGDKKKIIIDEIELTVNVEQNPNYDGKPEIISMGMGQRFHFDRDVKLKRTEPSTTADIEITFGVGNEWEPYELYSTFVRNKDKHLPSIAHELKHKYDKQAKELDLIGRDAEYQANVRYGNFGIPELDRKFMRFLYYAHMAENLVRPVEIASEMEHKNITKSQFYEFLKNNRVYQELKEIKDFTFEKFISNLYEQMDRIDGLLEHIGEDPSTMTDSEKIREVLEIAYFNLRNTKMDIFMDMTTNKKEEFEYGLKQMLGIDIDPFEGEIGDVRKRFLNYVSKFKDEPVEFFKSEIENMNYNANKMLKKISKLYAMAKDDKKVNESILDWDLYRDFMEYKYGGIKISTKSKYKI